MLLPEGVDPKKFYKICIEKNIHITSRFQGVCLNLDGKKVTWMARYQKSNSSVFLGRFPFTIRGEIEAGRRYSSYIQDNDLKQRYNVKIKRTRKPKA